MFALLFILTVLFIFYMSVDMYRFPKMVNVRKTLQCTNLCLTVNKKLPTSRLFIFYNVSLKT